MATFIDIVGIRAVAFGVGDFRSGMTQVRREAFITGNSMLRLGQQSASAGNAVTNFGAAVAGIGRNISFLGAQMSNLGIRFSTFITAPILGVGAAISKTGADFEREMTRIETEVGLSREQVSAWADEILEIAPRLGQLPGELARGLFFITSAGVRDAAEAIEVLEVAAKGASLGLGDMEEVARALAAAMNTFGLSAEDAGEQLLSTVRESQLAADELAPVIGRVLPVVEAVGGTFADAGAFIATYTRLGVTASVATTGLRSAMNSLIKPTSDARAAFHEAGLTIDFVREMISERGLARTLVFLRQHFAEQGVEIGRVITRVRGLNGVLAVTGELADEYVEISDNIIGTTGELNNAFERVTETTQFQWSRFVASINVAAQHIARVLLPAINDIIDRLVPLIERISEFAQQNPELVKIGIAFAVIAASLGPALFLFGQLFATIGTGILLFGNLIIVLGSLLTPIGLVTAAIGGLGLAFGALVTTFAVTAGDIARKMDDDFGNLADRARSWGYELIRSFAEGMIRAFTLVVQVLNELSAIFLYWLSPGSPPRLLPDIDKWGAETAQEWVEGWTQADFSVFGDIAQQVTGIIRGLGRAGDVEQQDIASAILGSREGIAAAINQFRQTGTVTQEVLDQITEGLGNSQRVVQDYILSLFRLEEANAAVEAAQENLNQVQQRYNDLLDPLRDRLDAINEEQARIRRQDERERLLAILDDPRATDEVRRRVRLALEELNLRDQIATIEAREERDVSAAERELQIAEERAEAIQAQVEVQRELIDLIREQLDLLAQTRPDEPTGAAAADTGGVGGGDIEGGIDLPGGEEVGELTELLRQGIAIKDAADQLLRDGGGMGVVPEAINNLFEQLKEDLTPAVSGLNEQLGIFSDLWAEIIPQLEDIEDSKAYRTFERLVQPTKDWIDLINDSDFQDNLDGVIEKMGIIARGVTEDEGLQNLIGLLGEFVRWLGIVEEALVGAGVIAGLEALNSALETWIEIGDEANEATQEAADAWDEFLRTGDLNDMADALRNVGWAALNDFGRPVGFILELVTTFVDDFVSEFERLYRELVGESVIPKGNQDIIDAFNPLDEIIDVVDNILFGQNGVVSVFEDFVADIVGANGVIPNFIEDVRDFFQNKLEAAMTLGQAVIDRLVSAYETVGSAISAGIKDGISSWFVTGAYLVANAIYQALRSAILRAIGGLMDALGWLGIEVNLPVNLSGGGQSSNEDENGTAQRAAAPLGAGPATTAGVPVVPGAAATYIINMDFDVVIESEMDAQRFGSMVRREVGRAIRGS